MTASLALSLFLAALIYVVTPGPAVLVLLSLIAQKGRAQGALFMAGHLVGDCLWGALALLAIVGVSALGPLLFDLLSIGCGLFLIYLGIKAMMSRAPGGQAVVGNERPLLAGTLFGLTNPKAYPVSLAVFTALVAPSVDRLALSDAPIMMAVAFLGFLGGNAIILALAGLGAVRRFMLARGLWVTRIVGATFVAFGVRSLADGLLNIRVRS